MMHSKNAKIERLRRGVALLMVLGGWLGSLAVGGWAVLTFDPSKGEFAPQWVGFSYIALIGIAVAASTARSRMRMTDTIVGAFKTGQRIADERWELMIRMKTSEPDKLSRELERLDDRLSSADEEDTLH